MNRYGPSSDQEAGSRKSLIPSAYDKRLRRKHQPEIELSSRQRYQPPSVSDTGYNPPIVQAITVDRRTSRTPTRPRPHQRLHTPVIHRRQHHNPSGSLQQDNPAEDLAWDICSHGILCIQCVRTQELGINENFGAFDAILGPGVHLGFWPFSRIVSRLSLRVQQLDIHIETKTNDDVFLNVAVSVQFRVLAERAYDAYYYLADTDLQIRTYVYDIIRSTVPKMDLDQVFSAKTEIADAVFTRLQSVMKDYGYEIVSTLVARITPNELVKFSMNEVNASKRLKEAVPHRAEAAKFLRVKQAEATAETLYLQGIGTARQRSAIAEGLKSSVVTCCEDQTASDVMDWLIVSQYLDTLAAVGADHMIVRSSPSEIISIQQNLPKSEPPPPPDLLWD